MRDFAVIDNTDSKNLNRREFTESILIVDDDPDFSSFLKNILCLQRYHAECVSSCTEAFRKISSKKYSLIMIDVGMPDMNGLDFFHCLREKLDYTELIVMTGSPDLETAVNIVKEGAFDYLAKPFSVPELKARIDALLRRSRKLSQASYIKRRLWRF